MGDFRVDRLLIRERLLGRRNEDITGDKPDINSLDGGSSNPSDVGRGGVSAVVRVDKMSVDTRILNLEVMLRSLGEKVEVMGEVVGEMQRNMDRGGMRI